MTKLPDIICYNNTTDILKKLNLYKVYSTFEGIKVVRFQKITPIVEVSVLSICFVD